MAGPRARLDRAGTRRAAVAALIAEDRAVELPCRALTAQRSPFMIELLRSSDDPGAAHSRLRPASLARAAGLSRRQDRCEQAQRGIVPWPVQMELTRIIINENNDQHIIFLKEVEGDRMFPIVIGIFEATSIDRRVKGPAAPASPDSRPAGEHDRAAGRRASGYLHQRTARPHVFRQAPDPPRRRARSRSIPAPATRSPWP